jgi:Radical SAM superfamily
MQTLLFSDVLYPGYGKNAGAYRIATELRANGYSCQVIDFFCSYTPTELKKILDKFITKETIWVGFSTTFMLSLASDDNSNNKPQVYDKMGNIQIADYNSAYPYSKEIMLDLFDYIRSKGPKILVGGARSHLAQRYDGLLKRVRADYYVHGFADISIIVLTKWLEDKSNSMPKFLGRGDTIESTTDYDYTEFNQSKIRYLSGDIVDKDEYLPIEIARGCIFKCKYCSFSLLGKKKGEYTKTKQSLVEEFLYNYETFGTTNYMFMDETTNDSMEKVEFIYDVINSLPFKIKWGGYARLELYAKNPEMAYMLMNTGLRHNFFGIETFNKRSGESVGKGMHPDKIKQILRDLKYIWKKEVRITSGLIIGLPYETEDTLRELENYLLSDRCNIDSTVIHPLILLDGMPSVFGGDPKKYGYTFENGGNRMNWRNEHMDFNKATEIANRIRQSTAHKATINSWTHMRLQNLGLSEEEIDKLSVLDYNNKLNEFHTMKLTKQLKYFEQLMQI